MHNFIASLLASRDDFLYQLLSKLTALNSLLWSRDFTILVGSRAGLIIKKVEVENPPSTLVGVINR